MVGSGGSSTFGKAGNFGNGGNSGFGSLGISGKCGSVGFCRTGTLSIGGSVGFGREGISGKSGNVGFSSGTSERRRIAPLLESIREMRVTMSKKLPCEAMVDIDGGTRYIFIYMYVIRELLF